MFCGSFAMQNTQLVLFLLMSFCIPPLKGLDANIGVILDLNTTLGKMCRTCISMAIEDFYSDHRVYSTMIVPHFRHSSDAVAAASTAIDLLKNTEVMAILGPQRSSEADFVIDIGDRVRVPIISPATNPTLSDKESPYYIRSSWSSSSQAKPIADIVKAFGWRKVVFIYDETDYGSGLALYSTEDLLKSNVLISPSAENDQILKQLYELKGKETRVFVVHMPPVLALRFFKMVKEAGMMAEGYAWIIADPLTSLLDSESIEAMQGVIGVKAYVPKSEEGKNFAKRWSKRFHKENPDMDNIQLNVFGLWAYDSVTALAVGVERVGASPQFKKTTNSVNLTDLEAIGISKTGPSLVTFLRNFKFKGLSGDYNITNGQLQPSVFEIVNVVGNGMNRVGFWTEENGISKELNSGKKGDLAIVWPGQTTDVPKGWEIPVSGKKLRVGVPANKVFTELIKVEKDAHTNSVKATGFCIDVFEEVLRLLPYSVQFEYIPFEPLDGGVSADYDDLVYQVFLQMKNTNFLPKQKYDAVVGDVTISANRSRFVDFTIPYSEPGAAIIVPVKGYTNKNTWVFMKPLTVELWLTIVAFFVFTGFVVWVLEHRVNKAFRGPPRQQVGTTLWFSFATLVFAHREKVISNLARFVVIIWLFVVLVLTSSYNANLTSMLTVQHLQSTDMIKKGEYVGLQSGSFTTTLSKGIVSDNHRFRDYSSLEEYNDALSKGSRNGGVAAIVAEIPYIRLFLSKYCHNYTMIDPSYKTFGFAFAFRKGSPLVSDVSTAIVNLKESPKMDKMSRTWFGEEGCSAEGMESLDLDSFTGLFLISGIASSAALAIFISSFLYENRYILASTDSIKKKMHDLARAFTREKYDDASKHSEAPRERVLTQVPSVMTTYDQEGMFSPVLSTVEIERLEVDL